MLIQQLWLKKLHWDQLISPKLCHIWINFVSHLNSVDTVKVPRHVSLKHPTHFEVDGFSNASVKAYGAYIFVRSINAEAQIQCSLVQRVSPSRPLLNVGVDYAGYFL